MKPRTKKLLAVLFLVVPAVALAVGPVMPVDSNSTAYTMGQQTMAASIPVVLASNQNEVSVKARPATSTVLRCNLTTTATTSTEVTGCAAPGASTAIYITSISVYGGVATGATAAATVQTGTGANCVTGTTVMYYCQHPATSGCEVFFDPPIKATVNGGVCILDATVGTKFITINGYTAAG